MKRVLIVHAHPEPQSFTTALQTNAAEELRKQGHEVVVTDLYALGFNPVASSADFSERANPDYLVYALEQRHAYGSGTLAPDIKPHVEAVLWADLIIFSFPIYWFSTPAILKGWIDRVLLSGPFYGGLRFYDKGGLRDKQAWVVATLGGQPHMFGADGVHGELPRMLSHLLRGTLGYLGFDVLTPFFGYHVPYITHEDRVKMLETFRQEVRNLDSRPRLAFPSLSDFDERLYPLSETAQGLSQEPNRHEALKARRRDDHNQMVLVDGMSGTTINLSQDEFKDYHKGVGMMALAAMALWLLMLALHI
ncbi:NAD(P)H-dependent oxidoreductase [Cupriavidus necator]